MDAVQSSGFFRKLSALRFALDADRYSLSTEGILQRIFRQEDIQLVLFGVAGASIGNWPR